MLSTRANCGAMMPAPIMPYESYNQGAQFMPQQPAQQLPLPLPSGVPTGPSLTPLGPGMAMPSPVAEQAPQTVQSPMYTPGFLRTQIGRRIRVEFLIGTNAPLIDRTGTLLAVGASYILIRPVDSDDIMLCDIYSIKFVTVLL